jgi:hypothetical protein
VTLRVTFMVKGAPPSVGVNVTVLLKVPAVCDASLLGSMETLRVPLGEPVVPDAALRTTQLLPATAVKAAADAAEMVTLWGTGGLPPITKENANVLGSADSVAPLEVAVTLPDATVMTVLLAPAP